MHNYKYYLCTIVLLKGESVKLVGRFNICQSEEEIENMCLASEEYREFTRRGYKAAHKNIQIIDQGISFVPSEQELTIACIEDRPIGIYINFESPNFPRSAKLPLYQLLKEHFNLGG